MKIRRFINNLGLASLFTALTAYSPIAPARLLDCVSLLLGANPQVQVSETLPVPHAIAYDEVKAATFTAHAEKFNQVMWKTFVTTNSAEEILAVKSPFFTEFIREHLPTLEAVHKQNRIYADEDSAGADQETKELINKRFKIMDQYLAHLRETLESGKQISYDRMLNFASIYTSTHNIQAYKKLAALYESNDAKALQARYPGFTFQDLSYKLNAADGYGNQNLRLRHWQMYYAEHAQLPAGASRTISTLHLTGRLLLPTVYPCGSFAFFSTFHLPINPIFMATEFELQDGNILISPTQNFTHDHTHFTTTPSFTPSDLRNPKIVQRLRAELEMIRERFKAENDPELLKIMYYLFYYNKFENTSRFIPINIRGFIDAFEREFSSTKNGFGGLYTLFTSLNGMGNPAAPAKSLATFLEKIAKVIYILSDFELQQQWGSRFTYSFRQKAIQAEYDRKIQMIKNRH